MDEKDRPVAGARAFAQWVYRENTMSTLRSRVATTNDAGAFEVAGIAPETEVWFSAQKDDASTGKPTSISGDQPVMLHISPANTTALGGRVVDRAGQPLAGALVRVYAQTSLPGGTIWGSRLVSAPDQDPLRTDAKGRFRTPRRLQRFASYRVQVEADGLVPAQTDWLTPGERPDPITFPDLVVNKLRVVEGHVLDRQGQPVAGATVFQAGDGPKRVTVQADGQGHYRMPDLDGGRAFLFAQAAGFRFQGRAVAEGEPTADLTLTRNDEAPEKPMPTRAVAPDGDAALKLARRGFDPYAEQVFAKGGATEKRYCIEMLARLDPAAALERIAQGGDVSNSGADAVRRIVAEQSLATDPEEALALFEAITDPYSKALALTAAADHVADRDRKLDLLTRALAAARIIQDPAHRLYHLGQIAGRLRDLGQNEQAAALFHDGLALARELPKTGWPYYARGTFAVQLARTDFQTALELIKDRTGDNVYENNRHFGDMAEALAATDPATAERLLGEMRDANGRNQQLPAVCRVMALSDRARARRLIDTIQETSNGTAVLREKARAFGAMAQALANRDKPAARHLLDEAFTALDQYATSGGARFNGMDSAATLAARLLPVAERIDPGIVPEFFWRTLSLRPPRAASIDDYTASSTVRATAILAALLARYDRDTAVQLLEPTLAGLLGLAADEKRYDAREAAQTLIVAATLVDPDRLVALIDRLPDPPDLTTDRVKNAARLLVAHWLSLRGPARWEAVLEHVHDLASLYW